MTNHPETFVDLLRHWAAQQPEKQAFIFLEDGEAVDATVTYQLLDQKARTIATRLQAIANPGDRVLLLYSASL
ncbi:MAG: hypothetical protein AAF485_02405, partial [Chloroflexota bacterium]